MTDLIEENMGLRTYVDRLIEELMKLKKTKAVVRASLLGVDDSKSGTPMSPVQSPRRGGLS